jgi:hypothetical protein
MTTTIEFITALFCQVDDQLAGLPKHPEAHLWPSEVVTLGLLHALKGGGNRPFYRWLTRDYRALFPRLPERSCPCRLRLNTRGLPGDRHRSKKVQSIGPLWHLRGPLPLVTPLQPAMQTHVACGDQLP